MDVVVYDAAIKARSAVEATGAKAQSLDDGIKALSFSAVKRVQRGMLKTSSLGDTGEATITLPYAVDRSKAYADASGGMSTQVTSGSYQGSLQNGAVVATLSGPSALTLTCNNHRDGSKYASFVCWEVVEFI